MKASKGEIDFSHREADTNLDGGLEGLVMVLFPSTTWDAIQELAKKTETSPGELMSIALKLLEEKVYEEARSIKDGTGGR